MYLFRYIGIQLPPLANPDICMSIHTVNPIALFYKKIFAGILLSKMKISHFCTFTIFM